MQAAECEIDMPTLFDFMDGGKECQDEWYQNKSTAEDRNGRA